MRRDRSILDFRRIVVSDRAGGAIRKITNHADDTVRRARISKNGEWIVYEHGVDLWVVTGHSLLRASTRSASEVA